MYNLEKYGSFEYEDNHLQCVLLQIPFASRGAVNISYRLTSHHTYDRFHIHELSRLYHHFLIHKSANEMQFYGSDHGLKNL